MDRVAVAHYAAVDVVTAIWRAEPGAVRATNHAVAMGLWLAQHHWDHAIVLTSDQARSAQSFARQFLRMVTKLTDFASRAVAYFWAVEGNGSIEHRHHLHALVDGTAALPIAEIRALWSHGTTDVKRYDYRRDAALYVAKGILNAPDAYDVSSASLRPLDAKAAVDDQEFRLTVERLSRRHDPF